MRKFLVSKTNVAYPEKVKYLLFFLEDGWRMFENLEELAEFLKTAVPTDGEYFIKNDAPVDVIWVRDGSVTLRVIVCERLSRSEVFILSRLLR